MFKKLLLISLMLLTCNKDRPVCLSVKSCNLSFKKVQEQLPVLQKKGASLYLQINENDIGSVELIQVLNDAKKRNINCIIWPLLERDQGPWANEYNFKPFGKLIRKTIEWLHKEQIQPEYIVINMENGIAQMDSIKNFLNNKNYSSMVKLLLNNIDREHFIKGVEGYKKIVEEIHKKGFRAMITTYPFMVDDFQDNDPDIQDLTNVPISGIDWDAFTFTPYRTAYSSDLGVTFTPYMVYEFGKAAKGLFREKARLSVGIIGKGEHGPGYISPEDLGKDIAAAKAAGIDEVDLFHLNGMIQEGNVTDWINADVNAEMPAYDFKVTAARAFVKTLDRILDGKDRVGKIEKIVTAIENLRKNEK